MRARYIQHVDGPACVKRVGAQHDHLLTGERSIELLFVLAELLPMICFDPESISADPYSLIALAQRRAELRVPAAGDPLQIELIAVEIPIATLQQLDLPGCQMPVEIRNCTCQRVHCLPLGDGIGNRPNTEFVAVQSGLEIMDGSVQQILLSLIENADMCPPRRVAHEANSGLADRRNLRGRAGAHAGSARNPGFAAAIRERLVAGHRYLLGSGPSPVVDTFVAGAPEAH